MSTYFEQRSRYSYYKYIRTLLGILSYGAESICDIGSNGVDLISWLPCQEKVSIDLRNPFSGNGVEGIKADFVTYDFSRKFDIVTCFQVMEHISDDKIHDFAAKLLAITKRLLIVSVPYMWAKDFCKYHVQDPVDEYKFGSWFNTPDAMFKPVFSRVIYEGSVGRMVVVFAAREIANVLDSLNVKDNWIKIRDV